MLSVFLIPLTYVIGYFITRYSIKELKDQEDVFGKLVMLLEAVILLFTSYVVLTYFTISNALIMFLGLIFTILTLFYISKDFLEEYKSFIFHSSMAVFTVLAYHNLLFFLLMCGLFYFKSSYDYLTNKVLYKRLNQLSLFLMIVFFLIVLNQTELNILLSVLGIGLLFKSARL